MFASQLETVWIFLLSQNVDLDSENYFSDTLDLNQTSKPSLKLIMFLELDMHKVITRSNPRELGEKKKSQKSKNLSHCFMFILYRCQHILQIEDKIETSGLLLVFAELHVSTV